MAKAEGRRDDETAQEMSQKQGPESWTLIVVIVLGLIGVIGLVILASAG